MARGVNTLVDGTRAAVEQFRLGVLLEERGDPASAELAYREADALGHAGAALNLGVLCEARGDLRAAKACYKRAHKRGDENGAFNLGAVLEERRDLAGAKRAYKLAHSAGHAPAADRLAAILAAGGDLDGAQAALRRAQERGELVGAGRSAETPAANRAARWAPRRRALLLLTTSAAVVGGALVAGLLPNSARTSATPSTTLADSGRRAAQPATGSASAPSAKSTSHRREVQGEACAHPDPRVALGACSRSGQGARASIDARIRLGHGLRGPGDDPLGFEHRLELGQQPGADRHANAGGHADTNPRVDAYAHPNPLDPAADADPFEWRGVRERGLQWRGPAQQRLIGERRRQRRHGGTAHCANELNHTRTVGTAPSGLWRRSRWCSRPGSCSRPGPRRSPGISR
jgi:hypothetical protein